MRCPACDADNTELARFCGSCGTRLTAACPHCAAPVALGAHFCTTCGGSLPPPQSRSSDTGAGSGSERRRVSVLFADLEQFTTLAESLDPEEVRSIQSRYFEVARAAVATYGGTIEKFIGDAVVAVWGAPVAHEDDAARAVLAGLELLAGVPHVGELPTGSGLAARAAVATGEAAVTLGAQGQGMVSGDVINTAARLQSSAPAGGVLIDAATRQAIAASRAGVDTAPIGSLRLKGKAADVEAFLATLGDVPGRGGGAGHAGPFVGRDGELRDLVGLFEAVARERRSRTVSIVGIAGIGKSRLAWELERGITSAEPTVEWLTGRAPAYGGGVAFAAVAEMVRRRCGIQDRAEAEVGRRLLAATLADLVRDADERAWIEPRLATLLDAADTADFEREELFAAWRRFFERTADHATTVLVFEDLQWADAGLLDFIEHLGTWTRDRAILIVTIARPELLDARPTWGAAQRAFTSLRLDRLRDAAMRELLGGRAPQLPSGVLRRILERAGGVPLYAVEVVRMLIDRGHLRPAGQGYRVEGALGGSDIPDSLHGILAARIDALPPDERALLMAASVLGRRFHRDALAAVAGLGPAELSQRIAALVERELLARDDELRSPARGEVAFVQDLVRELAYRTLSRAERFTMHLAAARHLESLEAEEVREASAGHLAAAYAASPGHADAASIGERGRALLRESARRATSLHAPWRALDHLEQALGMDPSDAERRQLLEDAATAARMAGRLDAAERYLRDLISIPLDDQPSAATRLRAQLASVLLMQHRNAAALDELEAAVAAATDGDAAEPAMAELVGQLGRARLLIGDNEQAVRWADRALELARAHALPAIALDALVTRGTGRVRIGAEEEGRRDLSAAVDEARDRGLLTTELRARNNLASLASTDDPHLTLRIARQGVEVAAEMGIIDWAVQMADLGCLAAIHTGDWAWAADVVSRFEDQPIPAASRIDLAASMSTIRVLRGDPQPLAPLEALEPIDPATDPQDLASVDQARAWEALLSGNTASARERAERAADAALGAEQHHAAVLAARATLWAGDAVGLDAAIRRLEAIPVSGRVADASRATLAAGALGLAGVPAAAEAYAAATARWRELDLPIHLALCLVEASTFEGDDGDAEADAVLARIGATGLARALHVVRATTPPRPAPSR